MSSSGGTSSKESEMYLNVEGEQRNGRRAERLCSREREREREREVTVCFRHLVRPGAANWFATCLIVLCRDPPFPIRVYNLAQSYANWAWLGGVATTIDLAMAASMARSCVYLALDRLVYSL